MSLFQAREWWSCSGGDEADEYDSHGMVVVDLFGRGEDRIITASLSGCVRIWSPHYAAVMDGSVTASTSPEGNISLPPPRSTEAGVEDLLLEERLSHPILAIAVGRFSTITPGLTLAVLHPHALVVFSVISGSSTDGAPRSGKHALFYRLNKLHEHDFASTVGPHFSPANMTYGPFGQVNTAEASVNVKDSIAVQSMDGQLAIFEQERFTFRRNLNAGVAAGGGPSNSLTYLLPGPLSYLPRTDSFVTINSEMRVDSFRYSTLAGAWSADTATNTQANAAVPTAAISTTNATNDAAAGRRLRPDWTVNIGEHAHLMGVGRLTAAATASAIALGASNAVSSGGRGSDAGLKPGGSNIAPCEIAIAGERSFFVLRDSGPLFGSSAAEGTTASVSPASPLTSAIRSQRKLDFSAACMALYARTSTPSASSLQALFPETFGNPFGLPTPSTSGGMNGTVVVSHGGVCNIYKGDTLLWAARLPANFIQTADASSSRISVSPVGVAVGRFAGMSGLLVFLSSRGDLSVCFCGTEPPVGSLTGGETVRDLDYATMEKEHKSLLLKIREMQATGAADKPGVTGPLVVQVKTPPFLDIQQRSSAGSAGFGLRSGVVDSKEGDDAFAAAATVDYSQVEWEEDGEGAAGHSTTYTVTARLSVPAGSVSDVRVTVTTPSWIVLPKGVRSQLVAPFVSTANPAEVRIPLACSRRGVPNGDMKVALAVSYCLESGETRTMTSTFLVPLSLAVTPIPPVKTATFKLTVDINRSAPPSLVDVFNDCFRQPPDSLPSGDVLSRILSTGPAVLSFSFLCGGDATILASKAGGRFRIQAGSMETLALITSQLCQRLRKLYGPEGHAHSPMDAPLVVSYNEPLPLADFFSAVDAHYHVRRRLLQAYSQLNDRAHEYRLVAKRLLVRWKEKSPQPLNGLDRLLEVAQENVMTAGKAVAELQDSLVASGNSLSCSVSVLLLLTELRFGLSSGSAAALEKVISPVVLDTLEQGWEEMTDASLTFLLRFLTLKGGAEEMSPSQSGVAQALRIPEDTSRLRNHMTLLFDRLTKVAPTALEEFMAPSVQSAKSSGK